MRHPKAPEAVAVWTAALPSWIEIKAPHTDLHLGLGAGEDEAISLAVELRDAALLMDDRKARTVAEGRDLLTIGTIAILDLADEAGLLDFDSAISRLQATTFHVEAALLESVRARVRARKMP